MTEPEHGAESSLFGRDPGTIRSSIRLNGSSLIVIGVAPRAFDHPEQLAVVSVNRIRAPCPEASAFTSPVKSDAASPKFPPDRDQA